MEIIKFETNQSKNLYFYKTYIKPKKYSQNQEYQVVNIYPDITYQSFIGFGGAITEASAYCYSLLSDEKKKEFLQDYFSNINYSLCRLTIGSCDFSLSNYSYSNKADLSDFSIEKDMKYIISLIKDALAVNPELRFLASPWSPPGFMKNTKIRTHGGKLLDKYKRTYAKYLAKYITSYKELGIKIDYITVQNEPNTSQRWESCLYTPEEEADFVCNYLFPEFEIQNIDTKILIYDHNKEKLFSRALAEFNTPTLKDKVSGIAFHWYTGNHFENINLCREAFPDKLLFHTEGCAGFNLNNPYAKEYAYDILNDLNSGINGLCFVFLIKLSNISIKDGYTVKTVSTPNTTPLAITKPISLPKPNFILHKAKKPAIVVSDEPTTDTIVSLIASFIASSFDFAFFLAASYL
jgi:glucosylceramidase